MTDLQQVVEKEYKDKGIHLTLCYPHILVRVLPKGRTYKGTIILPDTKVQNKPIYEGQVLEVYSPRKVDGALVTASVSRGDHVIFQHFEGVPVPELCGIEWKRGEYRLLAEEKILAKLHTGEDHWKLLERFLTEKCNIAQGSATKIIENLSAAGDIVMWTASKTHSGA